MVGNPPAYDGLLQMMSDDDGLAFYATIVKFPMLLHWLIHGICEFPQDVRV